ncbi:unnamed protein product [Protopolystoma xenopodis]|uniref:Uncharacterized protein n=1 Tax=Protopolystoma xenopodis TaxID=117903 RepID=A0A448WKC9_9PLAT|nr:unnamed protein product [Protopolystoma xenopodis]
MDPSAPLAPGDELTPSSLLIDVGSGGLPPVQCREIEEDVEEEDVKDFQMKNKGTKRPVLREATAATYDSKCKTMTTFMSDTSRGFDPQHQSDSETQDRRGDILSVDLLTLKRNSLAGGLLSTHGRARESRKSSRVHFCINPLTSSIVAAALSTTGGELDSDILSDGSGEYSRSSATSARVRYRLVTASSLEATALHSSIGETEDSAASRAAKTQRKVSFCDPHLGTIVPAGDPQNDSNSGSDASDTEVKGGDESADNDGDVSSGDPEPGSEGKESGGKWSHAASQGDGKKHAKVKIKNKYRNRARPISPPSFAKGNAGRHVTIHGPSNPEGEGGHIGRTDVPSSVTDEAGSTPTLPGLTLTAKDSLSQLFDKENVKRANEEEDDSLNVGIFSGSRVTVRPIPDLPHCSYEISMGMLKQHTIYQVDFVLPNQLGAARVELLRRSSWLDEAARLAAASSLPACSTMDVLDEFGASRDEELDEEERGDELEAEEECSEDKFGDEDWHNGRQSVEDYGIAPVGDKLLVGDSDHTESKNSQVSLSNLMQFTTGFVCLYIYIYIQSPETRQFTMHLICYRHNYDLLNDCTAGKTNRNLLAV